MNKSGITIFVAILIGCTTLLGYSGEQSKRLTKSPDTSQMKKAISVAVAELQRNVSSPQNFILISMEWLSIQGKYVWRATFKPKNLIPADLSKGTIGLGGEIFINIDLKDNSTTVTYGE